MDDAERGRLWDRAQHAEQIGRPADARDDYAAIVADLMASGERVPDYVLERLAAVLVRLRELVAARACLQAAGRQRQMARDPLGVFRYGVKLAQVEVASLDFNAARAALTAVLSAADATDAEPLAARIESLRWPGADGEAAGVARVEALVALAKLWAAEGSYAAATEALRRALPLCTAAARFVATSGVALFLAELQLDCGHLEAAAQVDEEYGPDAGELPHDERLRWMICRARRHRLAGRPGAAKRILATLVGAEQPRLDGGTLRAVEELAQLLLILNRLSDAEALVDAALARLEPDDAHWRPRFADLRARAEQRRRAADDEAALPFVPEQVWDEALTNGERPTPDAAPQAAPDRGRGRASERFADDFARAANRLLRSLAGDDPIEPYRALVALTDLTASTDSPRLRARTAYYRALVSYYGGDLAAARADLRAALGDLEPAGLIMDSWEVLRLTGWVLARQGQLAEQTHVAARAKGLLDELVGDLDAADRIFALMNKASAQDEFVATRVRSLAALAPSAFPIAAIRRWLDRCRFRRAALRVYRETSCLVGWDVERRLDKTARRGTAVAPEAATTGHQIERWVAAEMRLRVGRRRSPARQRPRLPADGVLLHFYVVPEAVFCFRVTGGDVAVFSIPVTRVELDELVRDVLDSARGDRGRDPAQQRFETRTRHLSHRLWLDAMLAGLPPTVNRLLVVPHDTLVNVPFAALWIGEARLCSRFATCLLPNARWVAHRAERRDPPRRFLGVGVSEYPGSGLDALPGAADEVRSVAAALPPETATRLLLEGDAVPAAVLTALAQADWAHIACHGRFDVQAPQRSSLWLRAGDGSSAPLTLADIQAREFGLSLVVLASCWSSSTAVLPGNELVCMPAAFLRGGAQAVLAPLWEVDDATSRLFMADFYSAAQAARPSLALAQVQSRWAEHPDDRRRLGAHWAPYVFYGGA